MQLLRMSHALLFFCLKVSLANAQAVVLSVLTEIGSWLWHKASSRRLIWIPACQLLKIPPVSAYAAEATTFLRRLHSTCIGEFDGTSDLFLVDPLPMKKYPAERLLDPCATR